MMNIHFQLGTEPVIRPIPNAMRPPNALCRRMSVLLTLAGVHRNLDLPRESCRSKKPEHTNTHFSTMVPQREIVHDASAEQAFKDADEDSTHEATRQVESCALEHAGDGPPADTKSNPLHRVSNAISCRAIMATERTFEGGNTW
jgi:hypothetical protein